MAPAGSKRRRGDGSYGGDSRDDGPRPSPYRPGNLNLGQHSPQQMNQQSQNYGHQQYQTRGGGRRRGSRGGRGGAPQHSPIHSPTTIQNQYQSTNAASNPMSPPLAPQRGSVAEPKSEDASKPSATIQSASTDQQQPQSEPLPYLYDYLTEKNMADWASSGKHAVVDDGIKLCHTEDGIALGLLYHELINAAHVGRINATEAGHTIREIVEGEKSDHPVSATSDSFPFDPSAKFLDTLSIMIERLGYKPCIRDMVVNTGIDPAKVRLVLDTTLLENLGMIRSTFVRMGIRQNTNILYRQSNYNLLREETEGYSKLLTELFTTSGNEPPTSENVEETFEHVKAMIGAFDLDVGRVLDITLDVFAAVLVKQYRFFVKFLRASSWWPQDQYNRQYSSESALGPLPKWALPGSLGRPLDEEEKAAVARHKLDRDEAFWERSREVGMTAFFELGGRRADESALNAAAEGNPEDPSRDDEDRKWIEITRTLPPLGNKVAAQVLGFKLRFYSSSARDSADILPVNLIYLAALLIKIGFISLRDLYPHIWPADPSMQGVRDEKMKEKAEREKLKRPGGGAMNALLAAAPLPDDTIEGKARESARLRELDAARRHPNSHQSDERSTPMPPSEEKGDDLPEPSEQKVQLLKSLLCIGAIPEALYMLGRFPWLPDAFPELPEYIHRILHHSLSKVYEPLRPLQDQPGLRAAQDIPDPDQAGVTKGDLKLIDAPARKTMRWAQLDKEDTNEAIDYKFYWDDWSDNVPVCQSVDDVFTLCSTLLNLIGVKIGLDTTLLLKLARIGSHSLASDTSDSNKSRWINLSKRLIVPALSFTKCNPGVVNEVFELINKFETPTRYSIYAEWNLGQTSRLPDVKLAFDQARLETKDVLKRISKTTLKPMARALAKVAYANPGIVFQVAIAQLESYENIVDAVVECARYFTYLAYDVLTWSLLSALGGTGRNRVQADGMLTSKWLAALSLFAGKVFKRYSVLNPTPVVQYVADQLRHGNSTDLIILEEITKSMAGIISDTNFNEAQVLAMAGGELLRAQTLLQLLDRRHESKNTAKRLMRSLTDSRLAGRLVVSLAQERQTGIYRIEEENAHPKLLGNLFDQIHRILVQYLDLLRTNLSVKDFNSFVPDVSQLIFDFGIDPCVAFWISRPSINAAVLEYDAANVKPDKTKKSQTDEVPEEVKQLALQSAEATTTMDEDVKAGQAESDQKLSTKTADVTTADNSLVADSMEVEEVTSTDTNPHTATDSPQQVWHPVLESVMNSLRPSLPEELQTIIGLPFYVTFWHLALSDLTPPMGSYTVENERLKKKVQMISNDRSDISIAGTKRKEKEKEAIQDLSSRMLAESTVQIDNFGRVRARIIKETKHWFADAWGKWDVLNVALLEHCFLPRILISPLDALYTYRMFTFLHGNGAKNFRTMGVLDQLFREKRLASIIFLCSAKEAENLGRFLHETLKLLHRWHGAKGIFEKEAYGSRKELPGFTLKMSSDKSQSTFLDYEDFRRLLLKWHRNLSFALKTCLSSGEYMHIRNAINLLNYIHQYFPVVNWMGQSLINSITELGKSESREDLKVAAMSLMGALKKREKEWILPQAFNLAPTENGSSGARSASTKPSTPPPDGETTKALNPKAPDFRPSPQMSTNSPLRVEKLGLKVDAEDGEIQDAKMSDAPPLSNGTGSQTTVPLKQVSQNASAAEQQQNLASSDLSTVQRKESPASTLTSENKQSFVARQEHKSTPPIQSGHPPRPDMSRNLSSNSMNGRPTHNLPSKPEPSQMRPYDHRATSRAGEHVPHDHHREPRFPERPELKEMPRDLGPERLVSGSYAQGSDRSQGAERDRNDQHWGNDRIPANRSHNDNRNGGPQGRDLGYPARNDRQERVPGDRQYSGQHESRRDGDMGIQHQKDASMPPPRSNVLQHPINPERAALIQGSQTQDKGQSTNAHPDRRTNAPRHDYPPRAERSSRGPSPARTDDRNFGHYDGQRDYPPSHHDRRPVDDMARANSRYEEPYAPTGPRTSRPASSGPGPLSSNDRFRESMKPPAPAAPVDANHGRLSQETGFPRRQTESQYGRLNSDNDIPSGPRMPNGNHPASGRNARNVSAPQPQLNTQLPPNQGPMTPVQDRQTPSGPSMRGSPRKPPQYSQYPANSSAPPTPVAQSPDTAGIHPDRLKALQGAGAVTSDNPPPNIGAQSQGPPLISLPPRGPNNNQLPSPGGPMSNNRGPPTGPAMPNDRSGRDKRTFAGIQNVLQQASGPSAPDRSGQGASIRGRGGRANNVNGPSPVTSAPPTPGLPRPDQTPYREDLFAGRPNGTIPPQQTEDNASYGVRGRDNGARDGPRDFDRRNGRHRSRSPGKDRPFGVPPPRIRDEDMPQGRDPARDRRGMNDGPQDRNLRSGMVPQEASIRGGNGGPPGRELRDRGPPRDMRRPGRDDTQYQDRRGEQDLRDDRDRRDGGGSGRKRGRGGDEGQGERNFSEKRTRR